MVQKFSEFHLKELFRNRKFGQDLSVVSGKKLEILQTGETNSDTGPDFRHSLVRINGITYRGDIELHRVSSDWYAHNHQHDRNYNSVILHVVGVCDDSRGCVTAAGRKVETFELSGFLSEDARKFLTSVEPEENIVPLKCASACQAVGADLKIRFLEQMGEKRFIHKVNKFSERLKDIIDENRPVVFEKKEGYFRDFADLKIEHRNYDDSELRTESYWDQLLYEGILEGLGYTKNTAPFRKLARNASLSFLREHRSRGSITAEAILFGAANLIPRSTQGFDDESKKYCEEIDSLWRGMKKQFKREPVDQSEWLFFKLRPQNFPTIRIAGAACLLNAFLLDSAAGEMIAASLEKGERGFVEYWRKILTAPARSFWTRHFVFGTPTSNGPRMLIGSGRTEELIINTVLPLTYLRGTIFRQNELTELAMRVYRNHSPVVDNAITLLIKEVFFGGDNVMGTVVIQQGALHLYRTLCSERRCERCRIGKAAA